MDHMILIRTLTKSASYCTFEIAVFWLIILVNLLKH